MASSSFYVGVIGNLVSVIVFLSPVDAFWRIVKNRSTEEFDSLPYICTFLNCSLWTYYGIIDPGNLLVSTINGFGLVVEAIFITIFLIYAPPRIKAKTAILVGILDVGFVAGAIVGTHMAFQGKTRIDAVGFLCAGLNIVMYGAPLAVMKTVVTTKSVEFMPFFLSLFLFINGGLWTVYALLVQDYFLLVPNGTGFLLGVAQLVLYAIYRNAKPTKSVSSQVLEEGWQRERLIAPANH